MTERRGDFPEGELHCAFGAGRQDGRRVQKAKGPCQLRLALEIAGGGSRIALAAVDLADARGTSPALLATAGEVIE
jgi:hypothetical protein